MRSFSPNIIKVAQSRRVRWVVHVVCRKTINAYKILVRKPERKRPLGTNRHRWEDNIKMDPKRSRSKDSSP
jgi:hypothetical protein